LEVRKMERTKAYWWCPACKEELDGSNVTFQEKCVRCGSSVHLVPKRISPERMDEICRAEIDGRLVVLPCMVGDTVYFIATYPSPEVWSRQITDFEIGMDGWIACAGALRMTPSDFKKRVYLTREDAEKALEGGGQDDTEV
jgi:rRNA maturation protein Nop10